MIEFWNHQITVGDWITITIVWGVIQFLGSLAYQWIKNAS